MSIFSIQLLIWNGKKYLDKAIRSVLDSSFQDFEFLIADNASKDNSLVMARKWQSRDQRVKPIISFSQNIGFAAGHNRLLEKGNGKYVLLLNQDVEIDRYFLEKAFKAMESDSGLGGLQGKILRLPEKQKIDSAGLVIFKNRRIINRGQGEEDTGQYDKREEIFGLDGALPVYCRKALEEVAVPVRNRTVAVGDRSVSDREVSDKDKEVLDESFFCYKEDVDLSWRLRLFGWRLLYEPRILGYHYRGSGESARKDYWGIIQERRKISSFSKFLSFKNQRLMQIKNEFLGLFIRHLPWILVKEIGSWVYVLLFEPYTWRAIKSLFQEMPLAFKKRKWIMANKKVAKKDLKKWFK